MNQRGRILSRNLSYAVMFASTSKKSVTIAYLNRIIDSHYCIVRSSKDSPHSFPLIILSGGHPEDTLGPFIAEHLSRLSDAC